MNLAPTGGFFGLWLIKKRMFWLLLTSLYSGLLAVTSGQLMVMKVYEPAMLALDEPVWVTYKFINSGDGPVTVTTFYDYTFYQGVFNVERLKMPRLEEDRRMQVEAGEMQEMRFALEVLRAGTFQDLPAKVTYTYDDAPTTMMPQVTWSTVNGKLTVVPMVHFSGAGRSECAVTSPPVLAPAP